MGTPTDVRTSQGAAVTALIASMVAEFLRITGRSADTVSLSDYILTPSDYEIYDDKLYLKGRYRDLYSITKIYELGSELSLATSYSSNGYQPDFRLGIIYRIGSSWIDLPMAIKITGAYGLNSSSDVLQIITEMVAAKSGLWKTSIQTESGKIDTIRMNITEQTEKLLDRYVLREV